VRDTSNNKISIIIPARNEFLLKKTIESTLEAAEGDIEIIAILDGYWPDPNIIDDPRVTLIHHTEPVGQRRAVNEAAQMARGKYILKTDGHSMFDKGFDIKLAADCEYDWTVIPRMYNLHAFDWVCVKCSRRSYQDKFDPHKENVCPECKGSLKIEYVWKPRLHKKTDFMYFDKNLKVQYWYRYTKRPEAKGDIVDIMNGVGACWFQHRDRFLELGGLDEEHGSWGQVGVEVGCKAWLSGGRHVVNRKTWFAHMFRTTKEFTFPYQIKGSDQENARKYSRDLWTNDKWPQQKRSFKWLLEKFAPVPTWEVKKTKTTNPLLSVIIPARNEIYLQRTIDDCLAKLKTDFEIVVGLDGYSPELKKDPRVILCHSKERIGMRPMINKLAQTARGKYLMRLDAHCIVAEGIDKVLINCYRPGNTVLAMRYELESKNWKRRERTDCPYRYLSHPDVDPKGGLRGLAWPEYAEKHKDEDIGETMTISGSNWLMGRKQFLDWGGLDEKHGTFGQEGVEISCMTWLSGGRVLVNKNTWYAHWNRGKSSYSLGAREKPKSMARSIELWIGDKWPHAKKKFQWLIDKFAPVPGWSKISVVYITANKEKESLAEYTRQELIRSIKGAELISVSQEPLDFGENICVGKVGCSGHNILRQMLLGIEKATSPYVAIAESDCLYPPEHFDYIPPKDDRAYFNSNIWIFDTKKPSFLRKSSASQCSLIGERQFLLKELRNRLAGKPEWKDGVEHGKNRPLTFKRGKWETFSTEQPIVNIRHNKNMHKGWTGTTGKRVSTIPYWGQASILSQKTNTLTYKNGVDYRYLYKFKLREFDINKTFRDDNFIKHYNINKRQPDNPRGGYEFLKTFSPFIESLVAGKTYTDEELKDLPYYNYLVKHLHPATRDPLTPKGAMRVQEKMRDAISLYEDIRDNGLKTPLDAYKNKKERVIIRGYRRLVIAKHLGYKKVPVRIFSTLADFKQRRYLIDARSNGRIENAAVQQFIKMSFRATNKYWHHNYTHLYDRHLNGLYNERIKILEIGVQRGASLLVWKKAFPKAKIFGIDIRDVSQERILRRNKDLKLFVGDQADVKFLKSVARHGPFDLIIDDGCHDPESMVISLETLWPHLAKNGIYVLEDIGHNRKQPGYKPIIIDKIHTLIDDICLTEKVSSVAFYPNICFIQKDMK